MTGMERRNYRVAVIVSIIFHAILFFTYFPEIIHPKPVALETYPVGMVELARGSGGFDVHPVGITGIPDNENGNTNRTKETKANPHKPQPNKPDQPSSDIPVKNLKNKEETRKVNPKTVEPSGETGSTAPGAGDNHPGPGAPGAGDQGTSTDGQSTGFGSGEGMVSRLGPPPPYPKNAMNEGKEGEVAVRILVLANGSLDKVMLLKSSGDSRLDKITITSITRDWQFKPVTKDYFIDLIFVFNLKSGVTVKFIKSETGK
jgi:TonB family protein